MGHEILTPGFVRTDERGLFQEVLNDGHWESLIMGKMNPDALLGNHYHKKTLIFFYVSRGSARIKTVDVRTNERDEFLLREQQGVLLGANVSHVIRFLEESEFVMLKSLRYNPEDPDTYEFVVED